MTTDDMIELLTGLAEVEREARTLCRLALTTQPHLAGVTAPLMQSLVTLEAIVEKRELGKPSAQDVTQR